MRNVIYTHSNISTNASVVISNNINVLYSSLWCLPDADPSTLLVSCVTVQFLIQRSHICFFPHRDGPLFFSFIISDNG